MIIKFFKNWKSKRAKNKFLKKAGKPFFGVIKVGVFTRLLISLGSLGVAFLLPASKQAVAITLGLGAFNYFLVQPPLKIVWALAFIAIAVMKLIGMGKIKSQSKSVAKELVNMNTGYMPENEYPMQEPMQPNDQDFQDVGWRR